MARKSHSSPTFVSTLATSGYIILTYRCIDCLRIGVVLICQAYGWSGHNEERKAAFWADGICIVLSLLSVMRPSQSKNHTIISLVKLSALRNRDSFLRHRRSQRYAAASTTALGYGAHCWSRDTYFDSLALLLRYLVAACVYSAIAGFVRRPSWWPELPRHLYTLS